MEMCSTKYTIMIIFITMKQTMIELLNFGQGCGQLNRVMMKLASRIWVQECISKSLVPIDGSVQE